MGETKKQTVEIRSLDVDRERPDHIRVHTLEYLKGYDMARSIHLKRARLHDRDLMFIFPGSKIVIETEGNTLMALYPFENPYQPFYRFKD